ncbi:MAG TPA: PHB depolymerase family esterase [Burkholderiaceae bacterium]|nr:PHB depolymerase family esterase [Burkholderiaceae bacterium]
MKSILFRAAAGLLLAGVAHAADAAQITSYELARPEGARHFLLATPDQLAPGRHPLVIVLHGHVGSAAQVLGRERIAAPLSVWLHIADREQLLVLAPDGTLGSDGKTGWNDCRSDAISNPHSDDVGFLNALIDKAVAEHHADPARVYVMGMSNGGIMAFRLATEMPARLAAFATVGASMAAKSSCAAPKAPVSALIVAGTADPIVPYAGGDIRFAMLRQRGSVVPVEDAVAEWRQLAHLPAAGVSMEFPHRDVADVTRATRTTWGADPRKLQVALIRVDKGGHTEPSKVKRLKWMYRMMLGPQNGDLEIAEEAWSFFRDKQAGLQP